MVWSESQVERNLGSSLGSESAASIVLVTIVLLALVFMAAISYFYLSKPACWGIEMDDLVSYIEDTTDDEESATSSAGISCSGESREENCIEGSEVTYQSEAEDKPVKDPTRSRWLAWIGRRR